jgi:predicted RNA-binding protein with RPS1 domain
VTDQNQTLPAQGSDVNQQGDALNQNHNQTMESLLNEQELNVDLPQPGEIRTGMIASISHSQILVSIGAKSEGVISGRELEQLSAKEREALKVGQEIKVFVISPEDSGGNVVLSFKRAQEQLSWENVDKLLAENSVIDSKITGFNKGGLIVTVEGLRGFVPSSQSRECPAPHSGDRRYPRTTLAENGGATHQRPRGGSGQGTPAFDPFRARRQHRDPPIHQGTRARRIGRRQDLHRSCHQPC